MTAKSPRQTFTQFINRLITGKNERKQKHIPKNVSHGVTKRTQKENIDRKTFLPFMLNSHSFISRVPKFPRKTPTQRVDRIRRRERERARERRIKIDNKEEKWS